MPTAFDHIAEPRLVYADELMIVLLKPEKMHTAPLSSVSSDSPNLCDWAFDRFPELGEAAGSASRRKAEGGLLHRLDYETSGLVLFARTPDAYAALLAAQNSGDFKKEYRLLAAPALDEEPRGSRPPRVHPRGIGERDWDSALRAGLAGGAEAEAGLERLGALIRDAASRAACAHVRSRFRPYGPLSARVACIEDEDSLSRGRSLRKRKRGTGEFYLTELLDAQRVENRLEMRVRLSRGFRHQIRAHLAWIGLPLAGDALYGGGPEPRLCLHASRLILRRPEGGELVIES
jgi:23S rRNA pseudouridine1911/1915/1917 synthase